MSKNDKQAVDFDSSDASEGKDYPAAYAASGFLATDLYLMEQVKEFHVVSRRSGRYILRKLELRGNQYKEALAAVM